jgi:hypothetical protein
MLYYKGLIEMRKAFDVFTGNDTVITCEELGSGILKVEFDNGNGGKALALINPHKTALPCDIDGEWNLVADSERAGSEILGTESGTVTIEAIGVKVYVK